MNTKRKHLIYGSFAALMAFALTSCDYSDFSLFGFFYKKHQEDIENGYKGNSSSSQENSSENSSVEEKNFATQTYFVKKTESVESKSIETYDQFALVSKSRYVLTHYSRLIDGSKKSTYDMFSTVGEYTRNGNTVTLSYEASVYTSEKNGTEYFIGNNEEVRKENIQKVFDSEKNTIALNKDGSFAFGTQEDASTLFTGNSNASTYYSENSSQRPTYNIVTLIDEKNYFLSSFAKDSTDNEKPVSALLGLGEYKKYDIEDSSIHGQYETIRIDKGYGYMFAMNGASPIKFDLNGDAGITQWYGMSFGTTRSIRVTKEGYSYSVENGIEKYDVTVDPYSFEVLKTDVDKDPEEPVKKEAYFSLTGLKNEAFTLEIYKDGTYKFSFTTYKVEEEGTWSYDKSTDTLILTAKNNDTVKTNTFSLDSETNNYKVNYVSAKSEQMSQEFEILAADWESAFGSKLLGKFLGEKNQNISLEIFDNGSYVFSYKDDDKKIDFSEKGSWEYDSKTDSVSLTSGEKVNKIALGEDMNYKVNYVSAANASLTQSFVISSSAWKETFPTTLATLKGEKSDSFLLYVFSNGSYSFAYTVQAQGKTYSGEEKGQYSYDASSDSVSFLTGNKTNKLSLSSDGAFYQMDYVSSKNDSLTQTFVMDVHSFNKAFKKEILTLSGNKSAETKMHFYGDGTYTFAFSANGYKVNESGSYAYTDGTLTLTCQDKVNTLQKNEDGTYTLEYISKRSAQMNQTFTVYESDMRKAFPIEVLKMGGASGKAIDVYVYSNNTYKFSFDANGYKFAEEGSWLYDESNDQVTFRLNKTTNVLKKDGDKYTMSYVSNASSQLTQSYEVSVSEFQKAFPTKKLALKGKKNESIQFFFYSNGTYCFYWENSQKLIAEKGVYSYDATTEKVSLSCKDTSNEIVKNEDGSYTLNYQTNLNANLNQQFDISKENYQKLIG